MRRDRANDHTFEDGTVPNPEVFVEDPRVSPVLRPDGSNYVHPKHPLGFDLRPKGVRA